jgi:hypothetical protein
MWGPVRGSCRNPAASPTRRRAQSCCSLFVAAYALRCPHTPSHQLCPIGHIAPLDFSRCEKRFALSYLPRPSVNGGQRGEITSPPAFNKWPVRGSCRNPAASPARRRAQSCCSLFVAACQHSRTSPNARRSGWRCPHAPSQQLCSIGHIALLDFSRCEKRFALSYLPRPSVNGGRRGEITSLPHSINGPCGNSFSALPPFISDLTGRAAL